MFCGCRGVSGFQAVETHILLSRAFFSCDCGGRIGLHVVSARMLNFEDSSNRLSSGLIVYFEASGIQLFIFKALSSRSADKLITNFKISRIQ